MKTLSSSDYVSLAEPTALEYRNRKIQRLEKVIVSMAHLGLHIRTGDWQGSAIADQWQAVGRRSD